MLCPGSLLGVKSLTMVHLLADDVRKGFNVHFAETFEDVYRVALDYDTNSI